MVIETPVPPSDEQKSALVERIIRGELTPEQARERHGLSGAELKDWVRVYRREARRAFDARVKSVLSTQGMDVDDLAAAEFSGNVEDMAIAELLQTISFGNKDAEIRVEHDRSQSHIWCIEGEVVDAECAQLRGAAAVYRLLSLERGRVHADFAPVRRARVITVSTQALLMESARRFDECRHLRKQLGDTEAVYVPSDRSLSPDVKASAAQFAALRAFDGIRSIDEVVQVSELPDLEALSTVRDLMQLGLLERVRESRTSLKDMAIVLATDSPESSFLPLAASVGARRPQRHGSQRWVWAVSAIGSATLGAAIAVRFADAHFAEAEAAARAARSALAAAPPPSMAVRAMAPTLTCPDGALLLGKGAAKAPAPLASAAAGGATPLCMARHEVTVAQYERCRRQGSCEAAAVVGEMPAAPLSPELRKHAQSSFGSQCNAGQAGRETHPINCVTFPQAVAYCAAQGGRLPTEAEWELAARGADGRPFPWGSAPPAGSRVNACGSECKSWYGSAGLASVFDGVMYADDDGHPSTAPVGSYPAGSSAEGILDLVGNVAEWTSTRLDEGESEAAPERAAQKGSEGAYVVRGGAFSSGPEALSPPLLRLYLDADTHSQGVGFRCVFEPSAKP